VDEAHHAPAPSFVETIEAWVPIAALPCGRCGPTPGVPEPSATCCLAGRLPCRCSPDGSASPLQLHVACNAAMITATHRSSWASPPPLTDTTASVCCAPVAECFRYHLVSAASAAAAFQVAFRPMRHLASPAALTPFQRTTTLSPPHPTPTPTHKHPLHPHLSTHSRCRSWFTEFKKNKPWWPPVIWCR
jgi:hypothetical protein